MEFLLREMVPEDEGFIYNCWLKSYRDGYGSQVPSLIYYKQEAKMIDYVRQAGKVVCAVFPEDPSEIVGFIAYQYVDDALVIHWLYTRNNLRGNDIATNLVKAALAHRSLIIGTHLCRSFHHVKRGLKAATGATVYYDPYLIPNLWRLNASSNI